MTEYPVDGPIAVDVHAHQGNVDVTAEHRDTATVEITVPGGGTLEQEIVENTKIDLTGGVLTVRLPQRLGITLRPWRTSRLRIAVRVPAGSDLRAALASADLTTHGTLGAVDVTSASGDLTVEYAGRDASLTTASGDLSVDRADGSLRVVTSSGDVRIRDVSGDLTCRTASGDLKLGVLRGSVSVVTASGDVRVSTIATGETELRTASGDVSIGVASGTGVWLDVATTSGDTRNRLAMADAPGEDGGPALRLRIRTISGDITLNRAPQVPVAA